MAITGRGSGGAMLCWKIFCKGFPLGRDFKASDGVDTVVMVGAHVGVVAGVRAVVHVRRSFPLVGLLSVFRHL